jgi:hypothetical protein
MTNGSGTALLCASAVAFTMAVSSAAFAQGMTMNKMSAAQTAPPYTTKVIAENEKLQVSDVVIKPGEGGAMRSREGLFTYSISGGSLERTYADGTKEVVTRKSGESFLNQEKRPYSTKNVGKTTIHLIAVQLK